MKRNIHQDLFDLHDAFQSDHELRRDQLMRSLPLVRSRSVLRAQKFQRRLRLYTRSSFAAAAVLVLALTLAFWVQPQADMQTAWADSLQQISRVENIHLRAVTPSGGNTDALEIWWRRPNHYRMVYGDQLVITNNGKQRCVLNAENNILTISTPEKATQAMAVLGPFGQLFTSENAMTLPWVKDCAIVAEENVTYKGEQCRKVILENNSRRFEFVVDPQASLIYEAAAYTLDQPPQLIYHMEVLDMKPMSDELFTLDVDDKDNLTIMDRRENSRVLPVAP